MKRMRNILALFLLSGVLVTSIWNGDTSTLSAKAKEDTIVLRVCNWEEYMDLGDWDSEEVIELENGTSILGVNPLYEDFEEWYYETYGVRVEVEYSCFGTNEDLYNQLTMGDVFDLVCPSDYMIMKLMAEGKLEPFSQNFYEESDENNYYTKGVSPYISGVFERNEINGESWNKYAACYMWGITGVLYNPEYLSYEQAATWSVFNNRDYYRRLTLKDNVRDTYFAALGYYYADELLAETFCNDPDYERLLAEKMNDVSDDTINHVEKDLQDMIGNIYALETDSGKADLVSGKIIGGYQWSGDAVYAMDLAEEDDVYLEFAVPKECTNLWFDGWVMLKDGIAGDAARKQAAEAFINFISMPENVVRNMYYIGYTSAISGGDDDTVFEYLDWCYGAEEDEADIVSYPVGYFFSGDNEDEAYIVTTSADQVNRQLYTQYPSEDIIHRTAIMGYYNEEETKHINQMWINIRCYDLKNTPLWIWCLFGVIIVGFVSIMIYRRKNQLWK